MPHPKRRHSTHRQGIRRSQIHLKTVTPNHCPRCGAPNKPHRVCENCGHYGFKKGSDKGGTEVFVREEF